jgi:hypothetical protein
MPSKSYQVRETSTTFTDSGGDKLLDLQSLADGAVKMSAYLDLGAGAKSSIFEVSILIDGVTAAPAAKQPVELWFSQSDDGTTFDGVPTTAPTATVHGVMTEDQTHNCWLGPVARTVSTTASDKFQARQTIRLTARYVSMVVVNNSGQALSAAGSHKVILTPVPQEAQ